MSVSESGTIRTVATCGAPTMTVAEPIFPPMDALTVEIPALTAATAPVWSTVATAVLLLPHVTANPLTMLPDPSYAVARSRAEPVGVRWRVSGTTVTDATFTTGTVIVAVPDTPSALAAIRTTPGARAVTTPADETTAMEESSVDQKMDAPPLDPGMSEAWRVS